MELDDADWPLFGWITDVRPALEAARAAGRPVVLGTLISTQGPSPRPPGSQMVFDGSTATGYFSGGCLEADVANHAVQVLADGQSRHLVYGHGSPWIDIRLLCGGTIDILLERIAPDDQAVARLISFRDERKCAYWTSDGQHRHVENRRTESGLPHPRYSLTYDPPWRLAVIGGDPIALAIANLAALSGFETLVIRPDGPAAPPPTAHIRYCRDNAATAVETLAADRWTAVVAATHDDDLDDRFVIAALRASAGYVGVLGSATRLSARRARLVDAGLSQRRIAALHAPIGAARCGKAPWEVATSVIAEIMQTRTERMEADCQPSGDELVKALHGRA